MLKTVKDGSSILDVGCGDGLYYTDYRTDGVIETIIKKNLRIRSIDIDAGAVPICRKRVKEAGLSGQVSQVLVCMFACVISSSTSYNNIRELTFLFIFLYIIGYCRSC